MQSILIVRLGSLGDLVHTLPVVAALREWFPGVRIDWLVDARYRAFLDFVPVVDRRLVINAAPRTASGAQHGEAAGEARAPGSSLSFPGTLGLVSAVRELRLARYDVAFDLQGLLKSAVMARLSGAKRVVGFSAPHLRERAAQLFYTESVDPGGATHVVDKNLAALAAVGITNAPRSFPLDMPRSSVVDDARARLGREAGGRFALINPGGGWPNKRWSPQRFGAVASALRARHDLPSLVLWGPGEEPLASEIETASAGAAVAAPRTSMAELMELSRAASLMVSGDTGPIHIAAATGTPIVGLYGPTDPARNGPWDPADVTVSQYDACVCHYQRRCRRKTPCLLDIPVEDVLAAIDRRLVTADAQA